MFTNKKFFLGTVVLICSNHCVYVYGVGNNKVCEEVILAPCSVLIGVSSGLLAPGVVAVVWAILDHSYKGLGSKVGTYEDLLGNSFSGLPTAEQIASYANEYASAQMDSKYGSGNWSAYSNSDSQSDQYYSAYYQEYMADLLSKTSGISVADVLNFLDKQGSATYVDAITAVNGFCDQISAIPGVDQGLVFKNLAELGATSENIDYIKSYLQVNDGAWPTSATAPKPGFVTGSGINYSDIGASAFDGLEGQTVEVKAALLQMQINEQSLNLNELRTQATSLQAYIEKVGEDSVAGKEAAESLEAADTVLQKNGADPVEPVEG